MIKIKTADGQKISGRMKIENADSISIAGRLIAISDIQEMKRNPLLTSAFTSGFLVYSGPVTVGFGVISGIFVQLGAYLLTISGIGLIFSGSKSPNFHKKYRKNKNWTFEPVTLP